MRRLRPEIKQIIYACGSLFNMVSVGMALGYPATLTEAILDPNSDVHTDKHTASWIASVPGVSGLIPVFIIGPIMQIYGRRVANLSIAVPVLLGWVLSSLSYSIPVLFLSRFLHSLGLGGVFFFAVCIGEFSSPSIRGVLLNLKILAVSLGIGFIHLFGFFLHWRTLALIGTVPSGLSILITLFWPETPDWLVTKGRFDEAEKVFFNLRGRSAESEREIAQLIDSVKLKQELQVRVSFKIKIRKLRSRVLWKPVMLLFCAILTPTLGGRTFFPTYSVELAKQISGDDTKGNIYTFIIDVISIISAALSCVFVKMYPRRKLLFYSGYTAIALLMLSCLLMYIRSYLVQSRILMWISLSLFAMYFFVGFSSFFAVSFILMGELFPLEYRAIGTVMDGVIASVLTSVMLRMMPILKDYFDVHGMFLILSVGMCLSLTYLYFNLPETKGRTLHDISNYFRGISPKVRVDSVFDNGERNILDERPIN